MEIKIEQLKTFSENITPEINSLLTQLDSNPKTLSNKDVQEIIENSSNRFFVARESINNKIVGMLTLAVLYAPSDKKGLFEDVVVDSKYRRLGIGKKLISSAINKARKEKIRCIDFTSRPERVEANKLYQHLGFKKRDTYVYRIKI